MKKNVWVNKATSFKAAQEFDEAYYRRLSAAERIETVQVLREAYFRSIGGITGEDGKRLRRVLSVTKPA